MGTVACSGSPIIEHMQGRQRLLRWANIIIAVSAMLPVLVYEFASSDLPRAQLGLGCVVCILGLMPMVVYLRSSEPPPFPFLGLIGLFYVLSSGLPAFYDFRSSTVHLWFPDVSTDALVMIVVGLTALYVAYYVADGVWFRHAQPIRLPCDFQVSRLKSALWWLLVPHLFGQVFPELIFQFHLDQFTLYSGYIPYGMFLVLWKRQILSLLERSLLMFVVAPIEVITRFASGSVAGIFVLVLFLLIILWIERRSVPWASLVCAMVLFGILNYTKMEYRKLTWGSGPYADASAPRKAGLFAEIAMDGFSNNESARSVGDATDILIARLSTLGFLTYVINQTPQVVPYWYGETYLNLFYKVVPRALWPNKPTENLGYEFSHRYSMRAEADTSTSFNVPWVVEMYANFGAAGVVIGMFLVGMLSAFLEKKLNHPDMSILELVFGATILFELCYQESNFSLMVGSKLMLGLILYSFLHVMLGSGRKSMVTR